LYTDRQTKPYRRLTGAGVAWLFTLVLGAVTSCVGAETTEGPDVISEEALPITAGSCSTGTENGGHTAVARCSGFLDTGVFRVLTTCCLTSCSGPIGGPWASHANGTSRAGCGSAFASNVRIQTVAP